MVSAELGTAGRSASEAMRELLKLMSEVVFVPMLLTALKEQMLINAHEMHTSGLYRDHGYETFEECTYVECKATRELAEL